MTSSGPRPTDSLSLARTSVLRQCSKACSCDSGRSAIQPQGTAEFESRRVGKVVLSDVREVSVGRRGSDIINKWVEVSASLDGAPGRVYLNDGGWLGWRALLSGSNEPIVEALAALTAQT
jgi:hypothetical protein